MERVTLDATELFEFRSAVLRMPQPKLDELADLMIRDASIGLVKVTGHTDRLGSKASNDQLSQQRAQSVRNYLLAKGIDGARVEAVGVGSSQPVKDCPAAQYRKRADLIECLAPNRRVEVEPVSGTRPAR
jgi:OOP family OmpA-OmpF porin